MFKVVIFIYLSVCATTCMEVKRQLLGSWFFPVTLWDQMIKLTLWGLQSSVSTLEPFSRFCVFKLVMFSWCVFFLNQLEVTLHFLPNLGSESILLTSCSLVPFTWNTSFYLHAEAVSIFDDEVHSWEITNRYVLFFKPFTQSCLIF